VVIKIIKAFFPLAFLLLSCSYYAERKVVDSCWIENLPYGKVGKLRISCAGKEFTIIYDNDPEGRDPFIVKVEGKEMRRISYREIYPYVRMSADVLMDGYAVKEVWESEDMRLEGFEFFTEGGRICYDWEEGYRLVMHRGGDKLVLLDEEWEGTECR
jgi:hypothetical protein